MTYLINFLLVPLYYFVLWLTLPRRDVIKAFLWIVAIHAILFRALANPYNYVDTVNYTNAYLDISGWNLSHTVVDENQYTIWGRGYLFYNWLLSRLSADPKILFVVSSVVAVGGVMLYYKRTVYTVLAPILFYLSYHMMYLHGFGVIRQHLAIPFLLFALYYIEDIKKSLCYAIVASFLHTACIVFFPFYLLRWLFKRFSYEEITFFSLSFFLTGRFFISMILQFFPRFEAYLHTKAENNIVPVLLIAFMILLLYEADVFGKVRKGRDRDLLMFLLYGFALSVFCIRLPGAGRLSLPIIYVVPTVMSMLYHYGGRNKDEYKLCVVGLAALVVIGLVLAIEKGRSPLLHYSLFWE